MQAVTGQAQEADLLMWNSVRHYHLSFIPPMMGTLMICHPLSELFHVFIIYSIPSVIGFNCEPLKLARAKIAYLLCNLYGLTGGACRLNHVCFSLWIWPKGSPIHRTPNFFRAQNDSFWKELVLVFQFILTDMISSSSRLVVMKSLSISAELLTKRQLKPHFNFQLISGMFPKTLSRIGLATFR